MRFCENLTKIERRARQRRLKAEAAARAMSRRGRAAAFRRSVKGGGERESRRAARRGASEPICGADRRQAPSGERRSENAAVFRSMANAAVHTAYLCRKITFTACRERYRCEEAAFQLGFVPAEYAAENADMPLSKAAKGVPFPAYARLFLSCQNATALAAATFSESTPCDIGMRTV